MVIGKNSHPVYIYTGCFLVYNNSVYTGVIPVKRPDKILEKGCLYVYESHAAKELSDACS